MSKAFAAKKSCDKVTTNEQWDPLTLIIDIHWCCYLVTRIQNAIFTFWFLVSLPVFLYFVLLYAFWFPCPGSSMYCLKCRLYPLPTLVGVTSLVLSLGVTSVPALATGPVSPAIRTLQPVSSSQLLRASPRCPEVTIQLWPPLTSSQSSLVTEYPGLRSPAPGPFSADLPRC